MKLSRLLLLAAALLPASAHALPPQEAPPGPRVALIKMPYRGARNVEERSGGPDYLEAGGLADTLRMAGWDLASMATVALTAEDEREYGEWHRLGLANGHLADMVADNARDGVLSVGLLGNCASLMGMLGGLQHGGPIGEPRRVGLIYIDAHGDFNTPETTLSGMLGGMPVAVSAGMGLHRLRRESGLDPALPTEHMVLAAVRDTDPLEQELIDASDLGSLSVEDLRERGEALHGHMRRLSQVTDVIYVHIDMDVLDPAEVPGHPLTVRGGPTSRELADALEAMFAYEKVAALGIASTPFGDADPDGVSRAAAYRLVMGALAGVRSR
jgi:arginase